MNDQRDIIYKKRNRILDQESIHEMVLETFRHHIEDLVKSHLVTEQVLNEKDYEDIAEFANENLLKKDFKVEEIKDLSADEVIDLIVKRVTEEYDAKLEKLPEEITQEFEKVITLQIVDHYWMEHINTMSHLREGIHLRGYAQEDPLRAYTMEGYDLFDQMLQRIDKDVSITLIKAEIRQNIERKETSKNIQTNDPDKGSTKSQPKRVKKVGRNDPCPCGSGKKYKQCCGK
jgi:preprotein translocase subunit SecA